MEQESSVPKDFTLNSESSNVQDVLLDTNAPYVLIGLFSANLDISLLMARGKFSLT